MSYTPLPKQYTLQSVQKHLTSAEILSLATPYTLVSSPGGGKAVIPVNCVIKYNYVSVVYANPTINFGRGGANPSWNITNVLSSATDTIRHCVPSNNTFTLDNSAFTVRAPVAPTTGDGDITITLVYYIVDL